MVEMMLLLCLFDSSLKKVVTEAQMVLTVAHNKAASKFNSFYSLL